MPINTTEDKIWNQISQLEDLLMDSIFDGGPTLVNQLSRLLTTLATTRNLLTGRALEAIHGVAATGLAITDSMLRLRSQVEAINDKRQADICDVMSRLSLNDHKHKGRDPLPSNKVQGPSKRTPPIRPMDPLYQPTLYHWLLENFHNPYPTASERMSFAKKFDVPVSRINDWFSNARRRIGWSSLVKRRFQGKRALVVGYAYRVYCENNDHGLCDTTLITEFSKIKRRLEDLCEQHSVGSSTLSQLGLEDISSSLSDRTVSTPRKSAGDPSQVRWLVERTNPNGSPQQSQSTPSVRVSSVEAPNSRKRGCPTEEGVPLQRVGKRRRVETPIANIRQSLNTGVSVSMPSSHNCCSIDVRLCPSDTPIPSESCPLQKLDSPISQPEPSSSSASAIVFENSEAPILDFTLPMPAVFTSQEMLPVDQYNWAQWDTFPGTLQDYPDLSFADCLLDSGSLPDIDSFWLSVCVPDTTTLLIGV